LFTENKQVALYQIISVLHLHQKKTSQTSQSFREIKEIHSQGVAGIIQAELKVQTVVIVSTSKVVQEISIMCQTFVSTYVHSVALSKTVIRFSQSKLISVLVQSYVLQSE
jgi:hypothetical protein